MRRGRHNNQYLQAAFNKHGEENFKFFVIERWAEELKTDKKFKDTRECFYINYYDANNPEKGYNLAMPTKTNDAFISPKTKELSCTIYVFDVDTLNLLGKYDSINECASALKISDKKISDCLNGRRQLYKKWTFSKTETPPVLNRKKRNEKTITLNGVTYTSKKEASEATGISYDSLCRNKPKSNYTPVPKEYKYILITPQGEEIKLYHAKDAINHIPDATPRGVLKLITGERGHYKQFKLTKFNTQTV